MEVTKRKAAIGKRLVVRILAQRNSSSYCQVCYKVRAGSSSLVAGPSVHIKSYALCCPPIRLNILTSEPGPYKIPLTSVERKLTDPCDPLNFQPVPTRTLSAPLRRPLRPRPITPPAPYPRTPSPSTAALAQPSLSPTFPATYPTPRPRPIGVAG